MALCAGLHFTARRLSSSTTHGPGGVRIPHPLDASTLVQHDQETFVLVALLVRASLLGPRNVLSAGSVAGLARNIHLRPRRGEPATIWVIVLLDVGRVAIRTPTVPVLTEPCPVKLIRMVGRIV